MKSWMNRWTVVIPVVALALTAAMWTEKKARGQGGPTMARYAFHSIGIQEGEMVRVSVANPFTGFEFDIRVSLIDSMGNQVEDSGGGKLGMLQTQSFDYHWARLGITAERGSGRKQFRVVVMVSSPSGIPPGPCRPGVEMIHTATGHTFALSNPPDPDFPTLLPE